MQAKFKIHSNKPIDNVLNSQVRNGKISIKSE